MLRASSRSIDESGQDAADARGSDRSPCLPTERRGSLVEQGRLAIRPGGYVLKRGRGRIVVEPAKQT